MNFRDKTLVELLIEVSLPLDTIMLHTLRDHIIKRLDKVIEYEITLIPQLSDLSMNPNASLKLESIAKSIVATRSYDQSRELANRANNNLSSYIYAQIISEQVLAGDYSQANESREEAKRFPELGAINSPLEKYYTLIDMVLRGDESGAEKIREALKKSPALTSNLMSFKVDYTPDMLIGDIQTRKFPLSQHPHVAALIASEQALNMHNLGKEDYALKFCNIVFQAYKDAPEGKFGKVSILPHLAVAQFITGNYEESKNSLALALAYASRESLPCGVFSGDEQSYLNIADTQITLSMFKEAAKSLERTVHMAHKIAHVNPRFIDRQSQYVLAEAAIGFAKLHMFDRALEVAGDLDRTEVDDFITAYTGIAGEQIVAKRYKDSKSTVDFVVINSMGMEEYKYTSFYRHANLISGIYSLLERINKIDSIKQE